MTDCTHKFIDVKVRGADLGRICNKCGGEQISTTPTDNTEWLDEVIEVKIADDQKGYLWAKLSPKSKAQILTHIDTVCREARIEELEWVKSRSAKHAGIWIDTKGNELDDRLTQLNPNKDTPQ